MWGDISLTNDDIIMVGNKIYMPMGARKHTLHQLHKGHCGFGKTLGTARELYYWPTMKYDIKDMIDRCEACQKMMPSKPIESFIHTEATFPMEMLSVDLFQARGQHYLVTADRFNGYIWVDRLRDLSTRGGHGEDPQDYKCVRGALIVQDRWGTSIPRALRGILQGSGDQARDIITL